MARPRVLIFSTAYLPYIGGAELAVQEITKRIPEVDFSLVTTRLNKDLPTEERIGNVTIHRIGNGSAFDKLRLMIAGPKLAASLGSFQLVWSIMASYSGFAAVAYKKKHPTVPYLLTLQEGDSLRHIYARAVWVWPWFKRIFTRADHIQTISTFLSHWAKRMGATCPVTVIPNGVSANLLRSLEQTNGQAIREPLHIPSDARVIVTVSRLETKNGVHDLIGSLIYLPETVHLVIVGIGSLEKQLRTFAETCAVWKRVHFVGQVPNDRVGDYLAAADVFCRPSLSEGLGTAFLEAMAAGVPVVATRVGGIPDFLQDRQTGLFCKVNDPQDIAGTITSLLDNSSLVARLRENGKRLIAERYTWDIVAAKIKQLF